MTLRQHNFFYVLAGLLFLLLAIPLLRDLSEDSYLFVSELAFSVFLMISVWSTHGGVRWLFLLGVTLAALGIGGNVLVLVGAGNFFIYVSLWSYIFFIVDNCSCHSAFNSFKNS